MKWLVVVAAVLIAAGLIASTPPAKPSSEPVSTNTLCSLGDVASAEQNGTVGIVVGPPTGACK